MKSKCMTIISSPENNPGSDLCLGLEAGSISVNFVRDGVGRHFVRVFHTGVKPESSVQVNIHKFFGGVISEIINPEDFLEGGDNFWVFEKRLYETNLIGELMEKKAEISVLVQYEIR